MSAHSDTQRYRPDSPGVAHEVVDGEVVIINLVTGDYYSCLGLAADAWQALAAGATVGEVATAIAAAYGVAEDTVATDLATFAEALAGEALLVPADREAPELLGFGGGVYAAPAFEKFSDMADLIILDPVHDVSGEGWPHATESG